MPLATAALKTGIQDLTAELYNNVAGLTTEEARERFADGLSQLMETFVKTGEVKYTAGLIAGSNVVTAPGAPTIATIQ